jgi:hypothetical protein
VSNQDPSGPEARGEGLIATGIIVASLCGLCSGCVVLTSLNPNESGGGILLAMVPFVGGIPTVIGLVMIFIGYRMRRRRSRSIKPEDSRGEP